MIAFKHSDKGDIKRYQAQLISAFLMLAGMAM